MIQVEFDVITCSDIPVNAWHVLGALIGLEFIFMDLPMFGSQRRICSIAADHIDILKFAGVSATKNALQEGC